MKKARVIAEHKTKYTISLDDHQYSATVRGSFFERDIFPKVGDWVLCSIFEDTQAVIEEILPRTSSIARLAPSTEKPQVIVANVDLIFIVMGLDGDFNLNRLERYLLLARQNNIKPVIVLNKADTVEDKNHYLKEVETIGGDTAIHTVSARTGQGMEVLRSYFNKDTSVVLLGSSGAGKSTITNWILGTDTQRVGEVRNDDSRGRHTTTSRQLFKVPGGGFLIDTPGVRELALVSGNTEDYSNSISKIDVLASKCRFTNCDHSKSDACAVQEAVRVGEVSMRELTNYQKMKAEQAKEYTKAISQKTAAYKKHKRTPY